MSDSKPVGVFAVDDHAPFLAAVQAVVEATPGFELRGSASSATEARGTLMTADASIDLVLMDIELGDGNGVELTEALTAQEHHPVVFLISTMDAVDLQTVGGDCGASAYIHKLDLSPAELQHQWSQSQALRTRR